MRNIQYIDRRAAAEFMPQPLENFIDPILNLSWGELGAVRHAARLDDRWHADVNLGYPVDGIEKEYTQAAADWIGDAELQLRLSFQSPRTASNLQGVKNIIAIASGKGGVGKSTTAVNLALGIARAGARAGLLDADIYGPSQGLMLGIAEGRRPEVVEGKYFVPVKAHGIEAMSMSMMVDERTPMVWRGPMASGALQQMLQQTRWSDLDYLIVDMPPGTGDIQLTLSQQVAVGGAVVVTTPQNVALSDARKGIEMFSKVDIPILGVVENMSYFQCDGCGKIHAIFDSEGGQRVASEYDTRLLGAFPLDPALRELTDSGKPPVASQPNSELSRLFVDSARRTTAALWAASRTASPAPTIKME